MDEASSIGGPPFNDEAYLELLPEFRRLYRRRPLRHNWGGMQSTNCFWVWATLKLLSPRFVIESGVWMGHNTWFLEQAAPEAKIFCLDPVPCWEHTRHYKSSRAEYRKDDFLKVDWRQLVDADETVCVFDDHQNQLQRAHGALRNGLHRLLFDDNYPGELEFTLAHVRHKRPRGRRPEVVEEDAAWFEDHAERYWVFPPMYPIGSATSKQAQRSKAVHRWWGRSLHSVAVRRGLMEAGSVPRKSPSAELLDFLAGRTVTEAGRRSKRLVDRVLYHVGQGAARAYPDDWYTPRYYAGEPLLMKHGVNRYRRFFSRTERSWQGNYTWASYLELRDG